MNYGYAVVAIDLPMHNGLAVSGHTSGVQWGNDFMALGAPLATRSNIQQAAFNLDRLEFTIATGGLDVLGDIAPSKSRIQFVGHSLGSMVGAYYLAGNSVLSASDVVDNNMRGLLSVPGARTAYLIADSPTFGPAVIQGLQDKGIASGSPTFHQFFQVTQSVIDTVDPATMTTPLGASLPSRLSGRLCIQEVIGDQVIGNDYTRYLGNALGGREVLGSAGALVAPGFKQLGYFIVPAPGVLAPFLYTLEDGSLVLKADRAAPMGSSVTTPVEGYFQFPLPDLSATHSYLMEPGSLAQVQLLHFLARGVVVDPSVIVN
jgi:hypothetical protein